MNNELIQIFEAQIKLLAKRSEDADNIELPALTRAMCECVSIVNGESMLSELHRKMMR